MNRADDARARLGPRDPPLDWPSHLRVVALSVAATLVLQTLAADPAWVETVWLPSVGVPVTTALAAATGWTSVSVAEIAVALLVVVLLLRVASAWSDWGAGRRTLGSVLARGVLQTAAAASLTVAVFYGVWGLAYLRAPLADRMGLEVPEARAEADPASVAALEAQLAAVRARAEAAWARLHPEGSEDALTTPREGLDVDAALEVAYARLATRHDLGGDLAARRPAAKAPIASDVLSWFGVGGVYVPFTGEATVNAGPPAWTRVSTRAHEKAHQRFVAPEDEANFVGFLACLSSDEPLLRYAGWMFAWGQLRRVLHRADPEAAKAELARLAPGPRADLEAVWTYWRAFDGPLEVWHRWLNDLYLRSNRVEGGVLAYGRSARLVAAWLETPEGRAQLGRVQAPSPPSSPPPSPSPTLDEAGADDPRPPEAGTAR